MAARDAALLALAREARRALDDLEAALARTPEDDAAELGEAIAAATEGAWFSSRDLFQHAASLAEAEALDGVERPPLCRALDRFEGDARALGLALAALAEAPPEGFEAQRGPREAGGNTWRVVRV